MALASRLRASRASQGLAAVLLLSTVGRAFLWLRYDGFIRGDEVEVLETAFRYGVDLDYLPWEIRNLTLPLLLAPALRLLAGIGVTSTDALVGAAVVPFILSGTLNVFLVFLLARRWSADERVPLLASVFYGAHWLSLVYGSAPFPRVIGTTAVLAATLLVSSRLSDGASRDLSLAHGCLGGALVGVAFAFRYSEALFLVPLAALPYFYTGARRASQLAGMILIGFGAACLLLVGVVDWLTWGSPFASLVAFFNFTLLERQSSSIEASQPLWWYVRRLPHWLPLTALPLLWIGRKGRGAAWGWLFVAPVVVGLSLVHHKELRYLQAVWPFMAILIAIGAARLFRNGRAVVASLLILSTIVLGGSRTSMVQKRSMAAVDAARHLQASGSGPVALSQPWAFGNSLYLGASGVVGLPLQPTECDLRALPDGIQAAGLYAETVQDAPVLRVVLEELGFRTGPEFRRSRSSDVVIFERHAGE